MKKILTILALMIATVAVVATGYTLTRPAKAAGTPVTYTGNATSLFSGTTTDLGEKTVEVTETSDGVYTFVVKQVTASSNMIGDFTMEGVTGTANDDGSVSYTFSGSAKTTSIGAGFVPMMGFTEGGTVSSVTLSGKSSGDKLYMVLKYPCGSFGTANYAFGSENIPGSVVGTDLYAPAGQEFEWKTDINWDTQKLVVALDVSGCSGSYENILSVGKDISAWNGEAFHLYYTRSSKALQVNYCTTSGNPIRNEATVDADELIVEITKAGGITVNGEAWNYKSGGSLTEDMSVYANLWALTSISVGSNQGDTRSKATYKYVRVQNLNEEPAAEPVSYSEDAVLTYGEQDYDLTSQNVEITETGENTYTVVYKNLPLGASPVGDLTAENVTGETDADGNTTYSFEGNGKLTNITATYSWMGLFTEGQDVPFTMTGSSKDGKLSAKFTFTLNGNTGVILYGGYTEPEAETAIYINTSTGTLSTYSPTPGTFMSRWTSTQTEPQLALKIMDVVTNKEANNISKDNSNETTIQAWRGSNNSDWNLSISEGWVITGYSFDVTLVEANTNVTLTANGETITPTTTAAQNVKVEGLNTNSVVAFTLQGVNKGVNITNWKVTYAAVTPEPEPEPVVYKDKAKSNFSGVNYDVAEQTVEITETGENTYKVVLKDFTLSARVCDLTAEGVTGSTNEDGSISYSYNGKAKISNVAEAYTADLTEGNELPFTMTGSSQDGKLTAAFTTTIWDNTATVTYGSTPEPTPTYPTYSFSDQSLSWYGSVTGKNSNQTDVVITDKGEGLYDINIKKLSCYGDMEVTFANVTGAALGKGTAFSTGGSTLEGTVSGVRTGTATMTVEGKMMGDQLYLFCSGNFLGWSDNPFTITVGTDFDLVEPVTYTDNATTTFGGSYEQTFENSQVNVYDNGDGTYKFVIKQYQFAGYLMGDFTADGVTGETNDDGSISYTFNGKAKASNVGPYASAFGIGEGTEVDLAFTGKSNEGKLYVNGTVSFSGYNCTYVFGKNMDLSPVTYTASAVVNYNDSDRDVDNQVVTITETGENTYTVTVKDLTIGETRLGDYTAEGVTGTVDEEGNVVYSFDGNAVTTNVEDGDYANWGYITENGEVPFKMVGHSKDGVLTAKFVTTFMETELTLRFNGYTDPVDPEPEPVVPGTLVGEDGYKPAGQAFGWTTDIDWNTQKLVAALDVTGCTGENENILSVGQDISAWEGETFHLYYTRSSNTLQVNYCTTSGNPIRMQKVVDADELLVEITKAGGITVNGEAWNYKNNDSYSGDLTEDMSVYANLWALTSIQVGSKEGKTRSNATYKYVRVQDVPVSITETATFHDDMTVTEPSTKEKTTENAQLDINTYSDGAYGVTIHEVAGEETNLGDITVKGLGVVEEDGVTYYNAETAITLNEEEWTATVTGVKYADGKVWFQVELMNANEDIYYITVGHEQKGGESGINAINAAARDGKADIYTINGVKVNAMQKGINIVRMNGKTVKIVKK